METMEQTLRSLLLQHPFLTPAQMAAALGVPTRRVRKTLPAIEGLRTIPLRSPALPSKQGYFITTGPEGGSRADVLLAYRQFAAIAIVYETRNFLLSLAPRRHLSWWDAFWREPLRPDDDENPSKTLLLHGGGIWRRMPFVLEWDRGALPARGLVHRARQLVHWYNRRTFVYHPQGRPALALVATTWKRVATFCDAWEEQFFHAGIEMPPTYATTRALLKERGWQSPIWTAIHCAQTGLHFLGRHAPPAETPPLWPGDPRPRRRCGAARQ